MNFLHKYIEYINLQIQTGKQNLSYDEIKKLKEENKKKSDEYYSQFSDSEKKKLQAKAEKDFEKTPIRHIQTNIQTRAERWMTHLENKKYRDKHRADRLRRLKQVFGETEDWEDRKTIQKILDYKEEENYAKKAGFESSYEPDFESEPFLLELKENYPKCYTAMLKAIEKNVIKRVYDQSNNKIQYDFVHQSQNLVFHFFHNGDFNKWELLREYVIASKCKLSKSIKNTNKDARADKTGKFILLYYKYLKDTEE